jgi:putative hydrolase of the HAD superfamily
MQKQTLIFDLDDTLIHCNKYFIEAIEAFADMLLEWFQDAGLTAREIRDKHQEIELAYVEKEGFVPTHFPQSLVDTYRFYAERFGQTAHREERISQLTQLGMSVYEKEIESYPHMNETLHKLQQDGHLLCLYTGGDALIQQKKIEQIGLRQFFKDRIYIEQHKNSEALARILEREKFDRDTTWMIGNSVRTDIVPALENGIHAIHIPAEKEWSFNIVPVTVEPKGAYLAVRQLKDIPAAIGQYLEYRSRKDAQSGRSEG